MRVYRELAAASAQSSDPVHLAAAVESNQDCAAELHRTLDALANPPAVFHHLDELLQAHRDGRLKIDAASVCVPTSAHFSVTSLLLRAGIDVLVEKPIAATLEEASQLVDLAHENSRILQVGHLERFNPAVTAAEAIRNSPMFFEAHRLSLFSPRSLDVDVVLDLMIHDLDIVLTLAQSPVRTMHAVGLPIVSSKVDIANVRLEFESGCVANFTASRVSTERVRKLRFFQPHQYVSMDYARKDLLVIDVAPEAFAAGAALAAEAAGAPAMAGLPPGLSISKPKVFEGEPLRLEIESFLECVRTRQQPRVSGTDGTRALELALQINDSIAAHAQRAGLSQFLQGR